MASLYLKYYLEEVLEDCRCFGCDHVVTAHMACDGRGFVGYDLEEDNPRYTTERVSRLTLFDLFSMLVNFELKGRGIYSPGGCVLVACRNVAGLTQAQFAAKLGAALRSVQKWEGGERSPGVDTLLAARKIVESGGVKLSMDTFFSAYEHAQAAI